MSDSVAYAKRLAKGSTIVFISFLIAQLFGFLLRMFLARYLTVEEYGLFYAVIAFISFFFLFRSLGLNDALVKYIPEFTARNLSAEIKSSMAFVLLIEVIVGLPITIVLFILSDQLAITIFKIIDASILIKIFSLWLFIGIFYGFLQSVFRGFQNITAYAAIFLLNPLLIFVAALLCVGFFNLAAVGASISYLSSIILTCALGSIFMIKKYNYVIQEKASITKPLAKKMLSFALIVFLGGLGSTILTTSDTIIITIFRSLKEVGLYQAAQPASQLLWYLPSALGVVLFPLISELWTKQENELLGKIIQFLIKFSLIIILPPALIFVAFPELVINLLFGPEYLASSTTLQILATFVIIYTLYTILIQVVLGIDRPIVATEIVGLVAGINLVLNLILIPTFGIEGAAISLIIAHIPSLILLSRDIRKFIKFTVPALNLLKTLAGGLLTLLLLFVLKSALVLEPWLEAFIVIPISFIFYLIWVLATEVITKSDLRLIKKIIPIPRLVVKAMEKIIG